MLVLIFMFLPFQPRAVAMRAEGLERSLDHALENCSGNFALGARAALARDAMQLALNEDDVGGQEVSR